MTTHTVISVSIIDRHPSIHPSIYQDQDQDQGLRMGPEFRVAVVLHLAQP